MDRTLPADCLARVAAFVVRDRLSDVGCFRDAVSFAKTSTAMCEAMRRALAPYARAKRAHTMRHSSVCSYQTIAGFAYCFLFLFETTPATPEVYMTMSYHGLLTRMLEGRDYLNRVGGAVAEMYEFLRRAEAERGIVPREDKSKVLAHFVRRH